MISPMMLFSFALAEVPEASIAEIGSEWLSLDDFGLILYCPEVLGMLDATKEQAAAPAPTAALIASGPPRGLHFASVNKILSPKGACAAALHPF